MLGPSVATLSLGVWPIIMGITMFLQQKLNPAPPDPVQAKIFMLLPIVFTFMLAHFPAGLVIYWAWNNLLSITPAAVPDVADGEEEASLSDDPSRGDAPGGERRRELEAGRLLFARDCRFVAGATTIEALPPPSLPEVAFAGRSNVGKSSLINALTGRNTLARVSHTPGRTQQINFFDLGGRLMLVDLPGYGFAAVGRDASPAPGRGLIALYLKGRPSLRRLCLLIDARHGLKESIARAHGPSSTRPPSPTRSC